MILIAPIQATGGISTWAKALRAAYPEPLSTVDSSPPFRMPGQKLNVRLAVFAIAQGLRVWIKAITLARRWHDCIWLATSPSIGFRTRDAPCLLIAKSLGVESIVHIHGSDLSGLMGSTRLSKSWTRFALKQAREVVVLDSRTQDSIQISLGRSVTKIPNFIAAQDRTSSYDPKRRMILFVGWVSPPKGMHQLLHLADRLPPEYRLQVAGPISPDVDQQTLSKFMTHSQISVMGHTEHPQVLELMERAALLVLPSESEGFPMVILEAMSLGLPVVATDVGAVSEMMGVDSLSPAGLTPEDSFTSTVLALITDSENLTTLSASGPNRTSQLYSPQAVIPAIMRLSRR